MQKSSILLSQVLIPCGGTIWKRPYPKKVHPGRLDLVTAPKASHQAGCAGPECFLHWGCSLIEGFHSKHEVLDSFPTRRLGWGIKAPPPEIVNGYFERFYQFEMPIGQKVSTCRKFCRAKESGSRHEGPLENCRLGEGVCKHAEKTGWLKSPDRKDSCLRRNFLSPMPERLPLDSQGPH